MKSFFRTYANPILFVAILLLLIGSYCYTKMQTSLFPEVPFPRITMVVDAGDLPVDRMMITVTKPLESAVKRVMNVTTVKSSTGRGSCDIDVFFKWGTDVYALKSQLESRVNEIKSFLPPGTVISTEVMNQSLYPVYGFMLESKVHNQIELRDAGNLIVRPAFSQVAGISNVVVRGGGIKEYVVTPDIEKMSSLGISPLDLEKVFNNTNFVMGNGYVANYNRLYLTLTDTRINGWEALGKVVVKNTGSRIVTVKDIAKIGVAEQHVLYMLNTNGSNAVQIDLVKQPGVNLVSFANDVTKKADEVRKLLPPGYDLVPYYNQSTFVSDSIHSVIQTILEGLLLALVVMVVFLKSWRSSLVVMFTIPVTITFAIILMYAAGITINIMSLGAVAASVGLILDDAIVIIEQIYREHEEDPSLGKIAVVKQAIHNLFPAMVASSLSTIVIYFPFRLMSGLAGSFFKELCETMQLTLVASFFVTWLLLPVLHLMLGYGGHKGKDLSAAVPAGASIEQEAVEKVHWLTQLYKKPTIAFCFIIIVLALTLYGSNKLTSGFLPDLDEGSIVLDYHSPSGTSLEETDRNCRIMEKIIMSNPNVVTYSRRTGFGMSFNSNPANFGDYLIQLKRKRTKTTPEVIDELRAEINQKVPVMTVDFGQRISDLLGDLMSTPQPIEVKIFGSDYPHLEQLASKAAKIMQTVRGVTDINDGLVPAGPSLVFTPKDSLLAQYGIPLTDFQKQLSFYTEGFALSQGNIIEPSIVQASLTGGLQIGSVQDGEQMRKIILRSADFYHNNPDRLKKQLMFLPDGTTKPLSYFCDISVVPGEIKQTREDVKSVIRLTARLSGRDLGTTMSEIQSKLKAQLPLPQGYNVSYGGAYSQQQQSFKELMTILCLAILLVLTILMFLLRKWSVSLLVLFISVFSMCGSILALWLTNVPLNVSSYTGIIMVVGIVAENSIFTVNQYKMNRDRGGDVVESVNYAIALRIRPKLMTAIGSILALLPLALGLEMGAQMQQPLAVAIIGGFFIGIPMLLVVLPSLMIIILRSEDKKGKKEEIESDPVSI